MTIDYYKMLSDPSHAWLNDLTHPFAHRVVYVILRIYFKFAPLNLDLMGKPQRLKYQAEKPCLRWYRNGSWGNDKYLALTSYQQKNDLIIKLIVSLRAGTK